MDTVYVRGLKKKRGFKNSGITVVGTNAPDSNVSGNTMTVTIIWKVPELLVNVAYAAECKTYKKHCTKHADGMQ